MNDPSVVLVCAPYLRGAATIFLADFGVTVVDHKESRIKLSPGASVLLVEDDLLIRMLLEEELISAGFNVRVARSADEGAFLVQHIKFDLLATDVVTPGTLNGWDLAEKARQAWPDIHVIYFTGFSPQMPRLVDNAVLFIKPFDYHRLLEFLV